MASYFAGDDAICHVTSGDFSIPRPFFSAGSTSLTSGREYGFPTRLNESPRLREMSEKNVSCSWGISRVSTVRKPKPRKGPFFLPFPLLPISARILRLVSVFITWSLSTHWESLLEICLKLDTHESFSVESNFFNRTICVMSHSQSRFSWRIHIWNYKFEYLAGAKLQVTIINTEKGY